MLKTVLKKLIPEPNNPKIMFCDMLLTCGWLVTPPPKKKQLFLAANIFIKATN